MTQLTVRNLDASVVGKLRARAGAAGHSLEQEVREILGDAVRNDAEAVRARLRARLASYGERIFSDSGELVREMRDRRGEA